MNIRFNKCSFLPVAFKHVKDCIADTFWTRDLGLRACFFRTFSGSIVYGIKNFLRIYSVLLFSNRGERKNSLPDAARRSDQQETQKVALSHVSAEMSIYELAVAQMLAEAAELALV